MIGNAHHWLKAATSAFVFLMLLASAAAAAIRVSVEVHGGAPPEAVRIEAWPLPPGGEARAPVTVSLRPGTADALLELDDRLAWRLEAAAQNHWAPTLEIAAAPPDEPGPRPVRLTLWPAGKVTAQLRAPAGESLAKEVQFRLTEASPPPTPVPAAAPPRQPAAAELRCPVAEKGGVGCLAPAGRWDVRVKVEGYAPVYLWNRDFQPSPPAALGSLELRRGMSLLGRVVTASGPVDRERVEVQLRPLVSREAGDQYQARLRQLLVPATISPTGYFQIDAVAAGTYSLEARQPGFEQAALSPLTIREGEDLELADALVLEHSRHLEVVVDPPRDSRLRAWRILLVAVREGAWTEVANGAPGSSGGWRSPPLSAGAYIVQVLDADGNLFHWQEVTLAEPAQVLEITMPVVEIVGTVRFGGEPVAGRLAFGGRMAYRGQRIAVESDSEGKFSAVLPHHGRWLVDIEADDPRVDAMAVEVQVPRRRGSRPSKVDIELPDTVVRGTVTDEQGRPVPGAKGVQVRLMRFAPISAATTIETDAAGAFEIHGQPPGRAYLQARVLSNNDQSDQIEVVIADGQSTPAVNLVVQEIRMLRGRVTSSGMPVPGARVLATAFPAGGLPLLPSSDPQATADLDGVFKLMLPKSTVEVQLVVLAAGHPLSVWRARLTPEDVALALQMGSSHGTLQLPRIDVNYLDEDRQHLVPMLLVDGEPLGRWPLQVWAQATSSAPAGDRLPLVGMPPGSYRYCELEQQEMLLVLWGMAAPTGKACSDGYLTPGGELILESPKTH